jgi:hypothetical protein
MFHWICPECGREIAPTVRECPACDEGAEQAELVLAGVVEASARTLQAEVQGAQSGADGEPSSLASSVSPLPEPVKWTRAHRLTPGFTSGLTPGQSGTEQGVAQPITAGPSAGEVDAAPLQKLRLSAEPLIPEILDAKAALDRVAESKASMRGMLDRAAETWANQTNPPDGRVISTRTIESRTVGTRASGTKAAESKVAEAKLLEAAPVDAKPVDAKPVDAKPVDAKAVEAKLIETKPIEAKPVQLRPVETEVAVAKPVEATPLDTEATDRAADAANDKPVETQPVVAPPFDRLPLLATLSRLALPRIVAATATNARSDPAREPEKPEPEKKEALPGTEAGTEAKAEAPSVAPESHSSIPAGVSTTSRPDVKAGVAPEVAQREPLLPTFAPAPLESLNALLAAASVLEEEPAVEGAADDGTVDDGTADVGTNAQPDPPVAGKLPLRAIPSAELPVVAPAVVSIGAVEPRALPAMAKPNHILVKQVVVKRGVVEEGAPATEPEKKNAREIAGLRLVETRLPLARPTAQAPKFAAVAAPVPAPPKSGAVRAPRSAVPFLAPNPAGLVKYSPLENRPILPVPPPASLRRSDTAPRITLPGPMLTRALVSFRDRELAPIFLEARAFRKRFAYGWLAVVLAAGTVLGVGFSSLVSTPGRPPVEARAASEASPGAEGNPASANPTEAASVVAPVHASGSNPLSKALEVTGFRIVLDPTRKPQVQYLVVNHSPARFPDATIYVSLRTADAHVGQAPLCRFSFAAPDLGPYEAKEMISAIEKTNRTTNLPEWQDLRAEIEIGR